jgi:hypothetical protein
MPGLQIRKEGQVIKTCEINSDILRVGRKPTHDIMFFDDSCPKTSLKIKKSDHHFHLLCPRAIRKNKNHDDNRIHKNRSLKLNNGTIIRYGVYEIVYLPIFKTEDPFFVRLDGFKQIVISDARCPRLIFLKDGIESEEVYIDLDKQVQSIGRSTKCDLQIEFESVSRLHALIKNQDGVFFFEDCESRNGTRINGNKIQPKTSTVIKEGDIIRLGSVTFRFSESNVIVQTKGHQRKRELCGKSLCVLLALVSICIAFFSLSNLFEGFFKGKTAHEDWGQAVAAYFALSLSLGSILYKQKELDKTDSKKITRKSIRQ